MYIDYYTLLTNRTSNHYYYYYELAHLLILGILRNNVDRINLTSTEHWRVISKF